MNWASAARGNIRPRGGWPVWGLLIPVLLLVGCAAPLQSVRWQQTSAAPLPAVVELEAVPFFAQERHQCGPAALATVLVWSGVAVRPDDILPQVYLPRRQGSLQVELLAAARRQGRVAYVIDPQFDALLREVAAGHPVIVLQNLGLSWAPRWHYAVVVGYDLERRHVVLRSGGEPRHLLPFSTFEHTWRRGEYWALAVMPPAELPVTAAPLPYLDAVAKLEAWGDAQGAAQAYAAATIRWPDHPVAWFGLGNSAYAQGQYAQAVEAYRRVLSLAPDHGPALNNQAHALAQLGDYAAAEQSARAALALEADNQAYADTLREVRGRVLAP